MKRFQRHFSGTKGEKAIQRDMSDARVAQLRGTPSLYINGRKYQGQGGYSVPALKAVIKRYFLK